eukprot:c5822_g1_i1 orf=826-2124(-)
MGSGGGGAGHSSHGFRSLGTDAAEMEKGEVLPATPWPSAWKTNTSVLTAPPGFTETEDTDDYMSGLAEEIAQSMLEENEEGSRFLGRSAFKIPESPWGAQAFLSTSPQSTLAGLGNWDLLSPGASSNGGLSSGVSSPPTPVEASQARNDEEDALDLLYAELLRLKMEDEIKARQQQLMQLKQQQHYQQLLWKLRQKQALPLSSEVIDAYKMAQAGAQYSTCCSTQKVPSAASVCYRSKTRSDDSNQVRSTRKQWNGAWGGHSNVHNQNNRQRGWGAVDQSNQGQAHHYGTYGLNGSQQKAMNGSGMRAVFLGTPGARESGGTGVFLPRRVGSGHDSKRKPACSTVLLPSRIVQALNLNVEDTLACPSATVISAPIRRDGSASIPARVRGSIISGESAGDPREEWASYLSSVAACSPLQEVAPDVCLPREWTY